MEQAEVEKLVGELEVAVDRLRSLYEQYFMGIEKLEPTVPRKDVDRRIHLLRKEQVRNTALRFRFQMIIQRYNTYQTHWQRICREIENGTYKRHLARAQKRFGDDARLLAAARAARAAPGTPVLDDRAAAELAELDREFGGDEAIEELDVELEEETPLAPRVAPVPAPAAAPASPPPPRPAPAGASTPTPAAARPAVGAASAPTGSPAAPRWRRAAPAPARSPEPAAAPAPARAPAPAAAPARSPAAAPAPAPAPARSPAPAPAPAPARPAAPAAPSPAAPASPGVRSPFGSPAAAAHASPPAAPRAPAPAPAPAPARPPAPVRRDDLPEERLRQLYSQYVDAKRRHNESTAAITYEGVAKSLRDSSAKLREKHGKAVDFEVSVKDGKTILKPVLK